MNQEKLRAISLCMYGFSKYPFMLSQSKHSCFCRRIQAPRHRLLGGVDRPGRHDGPATALMS